MGLLQPRARPHPEDGLSHQPPLWFLAAPPGVGGGAGGFWPVPNSNRTGNDRTLREIHSARPQPARFTRWPRLRCGRGREGLPQRTGEGAGLESLERVRVVCGVRAAASQLSLARRCSSGKGPAVNHYTSNLNPGQGTHASSRRLSRVFFRTHSARQSHVSGLTSNSELRQRSEPSGPCLALCSRRAARRTRQRLARTAARQRTRTRRPAGARPHTTPGLAPAINEIHTQIAGIARATPDRGPHRAPTTVQTEERRIENHENGIKRKKNLRKSKKTVARTEFDCTGARTTRPRER